MTKTQIDTEADVASWRLQQLLNAGYSVKVAEKIAYEPHVDLHAAIKLIKDCEDEKLAVRILL